MNINPLKWIVVLASVVGVMAADGCSKNEAQVTSPAIIVAGQSNDVQAVQSDVKNLINAVYAADVDTVLHFTHPIIVKALGGEIKAKETLTGVLQKLQTSGMKIQSLTFPQEPIFLKSDLHQFALVATKSIIIAREQNLESLNYQFGVKETGASNWTYIEGSRINSTNVCQFFPDFPSNFQFPDCYRKRL